MEIVIRIPVAVDGPLIAEERRQLQSHLANAWAPEIRRALDRELRPGAARIFGTVARFAFEEPKVEVE